MSVALSGNTVLRAFLVFQLLLNILKRNIKQGVWEDWWQKGKEIGLMQVPNNFDSYETCIFRWLVKSGRPKIG